ncbi:hypothetical protein D3C77_683850 [compost metagenome]
MLLPGLLLDRLQHAHDRVGRVGLHVRSQLLGIKPEFLPLLLFALGGRLAGDQGAGEVLKAGTGDFLLGARVQ